MTPEEFNLYPKFWFVKRTKRIFSLLYLLLRVSNFSPMVIYFSQKLIIRELLQIDRLKKEYKGFKKEIKQDQNNLIYLSKIRGAIIPDHSKNQLGEFQDEISDINLSIDIFNNSIWLYRYLMDGVAWRLFNFDRQIIRALGGKEPVPPITEKEGFNKEYDFFKKIRKLDHKLIPLLNDTTNSIRTGDVSVFRDNHLLDVVEIKQKHVEFLFQSDTEHWKNYGGRFKRQLERFLKIKTFLKTGNLADLYPKSDGISIKIQDKIIYNFDAISKTLLDCKKNGFGSIEAEPGLLYAAWDINKKNSDALIQQCINEFPHIFESTVSFRSISLRYTDYHNSLPVTAMSLKPFQALKIIFGQVGLITTINHKIFENQCELRDIKLRFISNKKGGFSIKGVVGGNEVEVGDGMWNRVMLEGLSIKSFIDLALGLDSNTKITSQ